jgi:GntR family transcriptional regulator
VALRINANTVAKVYTHLERSGVLETRRGVGTFIAEADRDTSRNDEARAAELRAIAARALADASARGFSATDLRRELHTLAKGVLP